MANLGLAALGSRSMLIATMLLNPIVEHTKWWSLLPSDSSLDICPILEQFGGSGNLKESVT